MKASIWPDGLEDIWAKSAEKGAGGAPESLADHTWAVLCRLRSLMLLRPRLPQALHTPRLWHYLYWAALLHDWGKVAAGFQARLRGGAPWLHRHEVLSLAFVPWLIFDTSDDDVWVTAAIVSHHRDAQEIHSLYYPPDDEEEENQLASQISGMPIGHLQALWQWLATCSVQWIADLGLDDLGVEPLDVISSAEAVDSIHKGGARSIYEQLRQYRRFVHGLKSQSRDQLDAAIALRGHLLMADHMASAHVEQMPVLDVQTDAVLASCNLDWDDLHDHQTRSYATQGQLLLAAPTGSGKTEAALLWAANQVSDIGKPPRLFYALPYQASMNAMRLRLQNTFGQGRVGLQHGRALFALYRILMEQNDYTAEQAARQARIARNLSELHYYPVRVFSPYQMLKAFYRLKGYESLLTDFHRGLFIFDEIHAYEPRRLAMILKSVEFLAERYGAQFLFMSATFPSLIRQVLLKALGKPAEIGASAEVFSKFQRHRLDLADGEILDDASLGRIAQDALAGRSALVCCNLIARAQQAYAELCARLAPQGVHIELLHGGFNMRDRSRKEQLVRERVGRNATAKQPFILVATQVVEVSLDIDLDTIYTEPAPLEALIQRFGRINRRRKQEGLASVHVFRLPNDGQFIYKPPELIAKTLSILERENGKPIDESAIGAWLDEIYSGELATKWFQEYAYSAREFEATCLNDLRPFAADENLEDAFYKAFDGVDVIPKCLEEEYQTLLAHDPIRAQELVVSISYGRLQQLRWARLTWEPSRRPIPIEVSYDSEQGLDWSILRSSNQTESD